MINSFNSVLNIFIMIGIGYLLARKGLFNKETNKLFSKLVINVSLPLLMIVNFPMRFTVEELINSLSGLIVAFLSILITYIFSFLVLSVLNVEESERSVFSALFTFCNSMFLGLPLNISLFGEESVTYVFLFYFSHTVFYWTIGVYNIRKGSNQEETLGLIQRIRRIFSPPMIGFIIAIFLLVFRIDLPDFLLSSFKYISNITTPLSMFFIGTVIYSFDFKEIKLNTYSYVILVGKFVISPLIMIATLSFFDLPILLKNVFIIQASTPIMSQLALVAGFYGANPEYVSFMVAISTLLSIIIIPLYSFILF